MCAMAEAYKHPAPHTHDGGVIGATETVESTKIDPLTGVRGEATLKSTLGDESIDATRYAANAKLVALDLLELIARYVTSIAPLGSQREAGDPKYL